MPIIKNLRELIAAGKTPAERQARSLVLDAIESAIAAVSPGNLIRQQMKVVDNSLIIADETIDLDSIERIFVVGAGKAGATMAKAAEEILGERISAGLVNIPHGSETSLKHIELNQAAHPEPDAAGCTGAQRILQIARAAGEKDLLICLTSGGGSSLLPLPVPGVSLEEKQLMTRQLLKSGAAINEINAVRKHISAIKGGKLAQAAFPARSINLIISDVIGDAIDVIASGPMAPDSSTFADAEAVLKTYQLWHSAPDSIRTVILQGLRGEPGETAKSTDSSLARVKNVILANNHSAITAAGNFLTGKKITIKTLKQPLTCSSTEAAQLFAGMICENYEELKNKPCVIVGGGETTVRVKGSGKGGRAQELALALTCLIKDSFCPNFVFAACASDGIDGPTNAAGALISNHSFSHAIKLGLEANSFLNRNDSNHFFAASEGLVKTGYTGTNVNDIYLMYFF